MNHVYFDTEEQKEIEIPPERWVWGIVYKDGSELHQFGNDGKFHRVGEINQEEIAMAVLYKYGEQGKRIDIPWRDGMKLVHKYRMVKPAGHETFIRIYMFGYKYNGEHSFFFVLPDDRIVLSPVDDVDLTKFEIV